MFIISQFNKQTLRNSFSGTKHANRLDGYSMLGPDFDAVDLQKVSLSRISHDPFDVSLTWLGNLKHK